MMPRILEMCKDVIVNCVNWTTSLFESMGASDYVLAGFILSVVVGMFLVPLRGAGAGLSSSMDDYIRQRTYEPKFWNGRFSDPKPGYKGKYETRKHGGHRALPKS